GAINAAWPIGDRLAPAEADAFQSLVELARTATRKLRKDFPLNLARQVRAWRRVRYEEFRKPKRRAQADSPPVIVTSAFMRLVNAVEKSWRPEKRVNVFA